MSNAALHRAVIRVIALNGFTEKEKGALFFQSKIGLVSFKTRRFIYLRRERGVRNQVGGLQWRSSVIFIPIPRLVNHLCTFPLAFDSEPRSQARIRPRNNKLTSCSGIVSVQIRGGGSRATGPLGHPRDRPPPKPLTAQRWDRRRGL